MAIGATQRPFPTSEPWIVETKPMRKTRVSCTKYVERQIIRAWKRVTSVTHTPQRASVLPKDFILVTSRRRSVRYA
ncbi:hypothetical protein F5I97DRAFT_1838875 [Phlebopus sp. FC_14]|nr:hypothetical protein F5I97DRAFT_1838875 [Phlebopus sp. FC_14]